MQIRLRNRDGQTLELEPEVCFVEILDLDGNLGMLIIAGQQQIKLCQPGDPPFQRYLQAFPQTASQLKNFQLSNTPP